MARTQSAALDRKKLMADPIMVTTIVVLITFLTLFILYPLAILLVDSFVGDGSFGFGVATVQNGVRPSATAKNASAMTAQSARNSILY